MGYIYEKYAKKWVSVQKVHLDIYELIKPFHSLWSLTTDIYDGENASAILESELDGSGRPSPSPQNISTSRNVFMLTNSFCIIQKISEKRKKEHSDTCSTVRSKILGKIGNFWKTYLAGCGSNRVRGL